MKNKEISTVMMRGRAYNSSSFLLRVGVLEDKVKLEPGLKTVKKANNIAFLAPKKTFTTAVTRNKAKRRLKAAVLKAKNTIKTSENYSNSILSAKNKVNLVFTAKKQVLEIEFNDLFEEMKALLLKI